MGKRGPVPKTDELRTLEGNPSRRPLRGNSPKPEGVPACPLWLTPEARREWKRVAPELTRLGLLTKLDRATLAGYCISYSWWRKAQEVLDDQGTVYVTNKGQLKPRPEVEIARISGDMMKAFAAELGMTPASRERIRLSQPGEEPDPVEKLLDGVWHGGDR
jgi:P27 family predicted phage terminase small subunit